jgi:phosphomethylpyrimidine synthase
MKQDKIPTQQIISTTPFPNSKKIYVKGKLNDIEVAMREITLSDTKLIGGKTEKNPPVTVYDTSGVYTDENYTVDVKKGIPRLREKWIWNAVTSNAYLNFLLNMEQNVWQMKA